MTSITWASLRYVQEAATILGSQNRTQGSCDVDYLVLFDGQRVEVDLLQALDLAVLHQTAQLGHGDPLLVFLAPATSAAAAPSPAPSAATSTASVAETSAKSSPVTASGWSSVRHCC